MKNLCKTILTAKLTYTITLSLDVKTQTSSPLLAVVLRSQAFQLENAF